MKILLERVERSIFYLYFKLFSYHDILVSYIVAKYFCRGNQLIRIRSKCDYICAVRITSRSPFFNISVNIGHARTLQYYFQRNQTTGYRF